MTPTPLHINEALEAAGMPLTERAKLWAQRRARLSKLQFETDHTACCQPCEVLQDRRVQSTYVVTVEGSQQTIHLCKAHTGIRLSTNF